MFSDHIRAFLWGWTMGLYFLYGRLRDIISTEPRSSNMLMYWKERKSAITYLYLAQTEVHLSWLSLEFIIWNSFSRNMFVLIFSQCLSNLLLKKPFYTHTPTWHLLSSMATSLRLTVRSILGEEKSTSDLGFIRSLASAEIGWKTVDQQKRKLLYLF